MMELPQTEKAIPGDGFNQNNTQIISTLLLKD
jgi:hypothetical protein